MQPRRQAGGHAASDAQDRRQDGPWLAGQAQRGAIQPRRLAWEGLEGAARPSIPMPRIGRGRRRRGAMPSERPHANLGSATGDGEFA